MLLNPFKWIFDYPMHLGAEIFRLLPDGIIIMTGLFALMTVSYSHTILFFSLIESLLAFNGLKRLLAYLHIYDGTSTRDKLSSKCSTGFRSPTLETISLFKGSTGASMPSAPIFLLSTLSSYLYNSLSSLMPELESLGPYYVSRFYMSVIGLCIFLLTFSMFRLFAKCDSLGNVIISILSGVFLGTVLVMQNFNIFGKNSVNLLGLPLLANTTADGGAINVCIETPKT
jgi:hypothetical protein